MKALTRRNLLITTALAGAAGTALWPRRALALRVEEDEVTERLYLAACEERSAHDQLVRDLIAQLEGQQGREQALETVKTMSCPVCGCRLGEAAGAVADPS
jgi:hypothetical protein